MLFLKGLWVVCACNVWRASSAELSTARMQESANSFSLGLLKELSGGELGNLVFSPLSVSTLLAVLHQGARGNSARQLGSVLRLTPEESREGYGRLSRSMAEERNTNATLEAAVRLFVRPGLSLRAEFGEMVSLDFRSGVQEVDFGSGEASTTINSWVSNATHGRITNIVDSVLPSNTVLMMANTVYFKSPWLYPFREQSTSNQSFSRLTGTEVTVPFMHLDRRLNAAEDTARSFKWVRLPFFDSDFSMCIFVPNERNGLAAVLNNLTTEAIGQCRQDSRRHVSLAIPRFKLGSAIELEEPLQNMGVTDIFNAGLADLSGISTVGGLVVSKAFQKADICVDEGGAAAAAATIVGINRQSAVLPFEKFRITADHPFLAVIIDSEGLPLFITVIEDPSV